MNIGIDIMGGDFAPLEAIQGIVEFLKDDTMPSNVHFTLFGDEFKCAPYITHLSNFTDRFTVVHAPETIEMHEHPTKALKDKPHSSINIGYHYLKENKIDAFVSAGNTGAMLVGALFSVKAINNVARPTIGSPIPKSDGSFNFLLDVGMNADCKPENLVQFAELGHIYCQKIYNISQPKIGLLNIGEEEGKGNLLAQGAYTLLKENKSLNFIGNVEGRDVFLDHCDVIVCEGFTGNVMLKMAESIYHIFKRERQINDEFLDQFNYELYGGTPVLGINAPVIIGHGISRSLAFKNMYLKATKMVESDVVKCMQDYFA